MEGGAEAKIVVIQADVTIPHHREQIIQATLRSFGRIDGLVNNAGFGQRGPVELVPIEGIRSNFETNLFSLDCLDPRSDPDHAESTERKNCQCGLRSRQNCKAPVFYLRCYEARAGSRHGRVCAVSCQYSGSKWPSLNRIHPH